MASSMVAPDLEAIGHDLNITNSAEKALALSIFVGAYALGPLMWAPLSELYGRIIILQLSNLFFCIFNLGCGVAQTKSEMIAFRFLSGIGGSGPLSVAGGLISDMFEAEDRGRAISVYSLVPLLGPAIGPIAGGWIVVYVSWRWVFYSTCIACVLIQLIGCLVLRETYAPVILARRRARIVEETGMTELQLVDLEAEPSTGKALEQRKSLLLMLRITLTRPFRLITTQPILQILSLYVMYLYGIVYLVLSTFPALWSTKYHQTPGVASLNYISLAIGFILGSQICAPLQDRIYIAMKCRRAMRRRQNGEDEEEDGGQPEFCLPTMVIGAIIVPIGLLIYSWSAEQQLHWIAPNVGATLYAAGTIIGFQCTQGYIIHSYGPFAASATAATTFLRSLAGLGFPLFAPIMYSRLGYGKAGSILAGTAVILGWIGPVILWRYGEGLRNRSKFKV